MKIAYKASMGQKSAEPEPDTFINKIPVIVVSDAALCILIPLNIGRILVIVN